MNNLLNKYKFPRPEKSTGYFFKECDYFMQIKHDGHRCILDYTNNKFKAVTRNKKDISKYMPYFDIKQILKNTILDGEIIHQGGLYELNRILNSDYKKMISRYGRIGRINFIAFDILCYRGKDIRHLPYTKRLKYLDLIFLSLKQKTNFQKIETIKENFSTHIKNYNFIGNIEGVVFKSRKSMYSDQGYKYKFKNDFSFIVLKLNKKNKKLISIELGYYDNYKLVSAGKIITNELLSRVYSQGRIKKGDIVDIEALSLTDNLCPREGSFKCLRPDINPATITKNNLITAA